MSYPVGGTFNVPKKTESVTGTSNNPIANTQGPSSAKKFSGKINQDCMPIFIERKQNQMCNPPTLTVTDIMWSMWNNKT